MRLLVLSDSHGRADLVKRAVASQTVPPDAIIHLGDGIRDLSGCKTGLSALYLIKGNCDVFTSSGVRDEITVNFGQYKFFMTHGHRYGVKSSRRQLVLRATQDSADVILFGHTHLYKEEYIPEGSGIEDDMGIIRPSEKPMYLFNPGSLGDSSDGGFSFGTIEIRDSGIVFGRGSLS